MAEPEKKKRTEEEWRAKELADTIRDAAERYSGRYSSGAHRRIIVHTYVFKDPDHKDK